MKGLRLVFCPQNKVLFFKVKPTLGADPCRFAGVLASDIHENRRSCVALLSPHQWIHYEEHKELFSSKRKTPRLQKKKKSQTCGPHGGSTINDHDDEGAEVDASLSLRPARRPDSKTRTSNCNKDGDNVVDSLLGCVPKRESSQTAERHCSAADPCEQTFTKDREDICAAGPGGRWTLSAPLGNSRRFNAKQSCLAARSKIGSGAMM